MTNVTDILARHAIELPDEPAITQRCGRRDRTITYGELEQRVRAEATRYLRARLQVGDRVLVLCPVSIELYVTVLALLRCGLTSVFVDPAIGLRRVESCCRLAEPKAVIATPRAWMLRPFLPSLRRPARWWTVSAGTSSTAGYVGPTAVSPDHPAMLTFTSGSTGTPRGVVRSHEFLNVQQRVISRHLQFAVGQRSLLTMPVFVLANLAVGMHSMLADMNLRRPRSSDARRLAQQIASGNPDRLLASPAIFDQLTDHCLATGLVFRGVRRIDTGGAPVFPGTLEKIRRVMPEARVMVVYGSTEAEPIAVFDATEQDETLRQRVYGGEGLPAGDVVPELDVRLLNPETANRPLTSGELERCSVGNMRVGEITVRGDHVAGGYLNGWGDQHTKLAVDGATWHRTGDLGRFDTAGRLWLLGRVTGRLHDDRGSAEPLAVEASAMQHAAVGRCALASLDGTRVLVVQPTRAARTGWQHELLEQLAWAKLDRIIVVRKIPVDRRHRAKIDYPALCRLIGTESGRSSEST